MAYFYIAGTPDCPYFGHALHVAHFLEQRLPNFNVIKVEKDPAYWKIWLKKKNLCNSWHHNDSPLIWKTIIMRDSKPYYIGGLSEFWEYCYDYYNLESLLPKKELQNIVQDSLQYFQSEENKKKEQIQLSNKLTVCIHSGEPKMLTVFLSELYTTEEFNKFEYLHVKVYHRKKDYDLEETVEAYEGFVSKFIITCEYTNNIQYALEDTDLLVIFGDYSRAAKPDFKKWLDKNRIAAVTLSTSLNYFAKPSLRVIVAIHGPVCFYASLLEASSYKLDGRNIVAVTADLGYEALNLVAKETNTPLSSLGLPPVWGFAGINHCIDIHHIIEKSEVYRPYNRALKTIPYSTLVSGTKVTEYRYLGYKTYFLQDFWRKLKRSKELTREKLFRPTYLPKVQATISVIKNWYAETPNNNIISLGILSVGADVITAGVIYSMPVALEKGIWKAAKKFPKPTKDICLQEEFLSFVYEILENFELDHRFVDVL